MGSQNMHISRLESVTPVTDERRCRSQREEIMIGKLVASSNRRDILEGQWLTGPSCSMAAR